MADKILKSLDIVQLSSTPANPGSGFMRVYGKTDGKLYAKSPGGTEHDLTAGGGGAMTINSQSGTSYTLVLSDGLNVLVRCNNASAITVTVPTNASVAFPVPTVISIEQQGAGIVTVSPAGGVTINTTARKTWGQNSVIQLIKVGTDTWNVINGTV